MIHITALGALCAYLMGMENKATTQINGTDHPSFMNSEYSRSSRVAALLCVERKARQAAQVDHAHTEALEEAARVMENAHCAMVKAEGQVMCAHNAHKQATKEYRDAVRAAAHARRLTRGG